LIKYINVKEKVLHPDAKTFHEMLITLFDISRKRHPDINLINDWWVKLEKYPLNIVSEAFDFWTSHSSLHPKPYDIMCICRKKHQEVLNMQQPKLNKPKSSPMPPEIKEQINELFKINKGE
jgi:hypothetical protein